MTRLRLGWQIVFCSVVVMRRWGAIFDPARPAPEKTCDGVSPRDRVYRRAGHVSWTYQHLMLSWGGVVEHIYNKPKGPNRSPTCGNSFHDPSIIVTYDPATGVWGTLRTGGEVPPPTLSGVGVCVSGVLYVFGGLVQTEEDGGDDYIDILYSSSQSLYSLNIETRTWRKLSPAGEPPPRSEKGAGWEYQGWLYFFGGYSSESQEDKSVQLGYDQTEDPFTGRVWHNALVRYEVETNKYEWQKIKGSAPCPRAGAGVCVDGDYVYIFGGRCKHRRLNDLHCIDLTTMTATMIDPGSEPDPFGPPDPFLPAPRSLHSMVNVGGSRLVVYGGVGQLCSPLNDCWILHVNESIVCWEEVELPYDHGQVRCWHSGTLSLDGELLIHSGFTQEFYITRLDLDDHCESVLHIKFGVMSLRRLALEAVIKIVEKTDKTHFLDVLPLVLQHSVTTRLRLEDLDHVRPAPKETHYTRERIRAGI